MNFYYLLAKGEYAAKVLGDFDSYNIWDSMASYEKLPINFVTDSPQDYMFTIIGCTLFSEKLKNKVTTNLGTNDEMKWISTKLLHGAQELNYYIPYFGYVPDVLNIEKTIFVEADNSVLKACLDKNKVQKFSFFTLSNNEPFGFLIVSEKIRNAIVKEELTGVKFMKVLMA